MRYRRLSYLPLAVVVVAGSALAFYTNWVLRTPSVADPHGDAVVVHAGQADRVVHALDLMNQGAAPTLVFMYGERDSRRGSLCGQRHPFEVLCPEPEPVTTIGEAREVGRLVDERGWKSIVTVTSDYHLRRATYLDGKCSNAEVIASGSGHGVDLRRWARLSIHEMLGMVQAWFVDCRAENSAAAVEP